jgi:purine-nucleoside phosphorylase
MTRPRKEEMSMRNRILAAFTILTSVCWFGSAGAENLSSKLGDVVSAAASAQSQNSSQSQSIAAPADATEREALTAKAREAAKQALPSSQAEQKVSE